MMHEHSGWDTRRRRGAGTVRQGLAAASCAPHASTHLGVHGLQGGGALVGEEGDVGSGQGGHLALGALHRRLQALRHIGRARSIGGRGVGGGGARRRGHTRQALQLHMVCWRAIREGRFGEQRRGWRTGTTDPRRGVGRWTEIKQQEQAGRREGRRLKRARSTIGPAPHALAAGRGEGNFLHALGLATSLDASAVIAQRNQTLEALVDRHNTRTHLDFPSARPFSVHRGLRTCHQ